MKRRKKKKPVTISRNVAVRRLDEMILLIVQNVRIGLEIEAALETANEIVMSNVREANFYGAACYNTVKDCMALSLALTLARLFDPGAARFHPNKSNVASIPLLVRLLKQKRCRAVLVARAREWTPQMPNLADSQATACERAIDCAIEAYAELQRTHDGRRAAETLKQFRDKKLAHSLISSALKVLPQYRLLFLLMDVARNVTGHAKLAILGENLDLKGVEEERRRVSEAFWNPAIKAAVADAEPT